jgi:hypothetical protein
VIEAVQALVALALQEAKLYYLEAQAVWAMLD